MTLIFSLLMDDIFKVLLDIWIISYFGFARHLYRSLLDSFFFLGIIGDILFIAGFLIFLDKCCWR